MDGTVGGAGHAGEILRATAPDGILIGIDADEEAIAESERRLAGFGKRKILIQGNYSSLAKILFELNIREVDGILLDLGVSSHQLETAARGFSFSIDGPLDMRFDRNQKWSAYDLVNRYSEGELARIIREYGEETMARRIARAITGAREKSPIKSTGELASIISRAVPARAGRKKIHPATRAFQAIRIAVNNELADLLKVIDEGIDFLRPSGRFSIITFHSLEDRIVKNAFRSWERGCICPADVPVCTCCRQAKLKVFTRRPLTPGPDEIRFNPRARSAKLRTAERI